MFRPHTYDPIKENSAYEETSQYDTDKEISSYSDENDTTNLSKIYHYDTSEDHEDGADNDHRENCCPEINKELIVYKLFYFIFFGAVGALFPYLAVFYKQLWLSPHQVGILIGLRPFIQMCASPLWGVLADTYNVSKWIMLMSIGAWLASNYSISLVKPKQYEPGCDFNLTYLPLTDDVDDQDFSWARIEPIVSKKYNVSHPRLAGNLGNNHESVESRIYSKPDLGKEDHSGDKNLDKDYDENEIFNYDYDDEMDFNNDEEKFLKHAEKSEPLSLYATNEKLKMGENESIWDRKTEEKPEKRNNYGKKDQVRSNDQSILGKVKNETVMKILEKMFKWQREPDVNLKEENTRMRGGDFAGRKRDKRKGSKTPDRSKHKRESKAKHFEINAKQRRSEHLRRGTTPVDNRGDILVKSPKNERSVVNKDRRNPKLRSITDEGIADQDSQREESDEYLEDVLSDTQKGEYFAESILPNQRVLAKEGLKEEFDSLKATEGMFWPIVNRPDPTNSSEVGNKGHIPETKRIFNILLVITICGTILSSPAATLADTATLQVLGDDKYRYGQQRLWGAFGWGLGAFIVGAIVSVLQDIAPCADPKHIDYILSFHVYAVAMGLSFICALFFKFAPVSDTSYRESFWEAVKLFVDCQHLCFILTLLCAGASMGFTHTFLFWHLHDIGGSQFLFSIIAAVQCISEVFMYFVSGYLILKIGCDSVLYIGLLANVLRLFTYSVITQPYFSVLLEVLQGISSASIWTAAVCYVGLNDGVQVTLQAMLHGIYWGLGHGGGGMLGGVVVSSLGSNATFIIFGICCIVNLAILLIMKYWKKLFELLSGYTSVETIPTGTYILVETHRTSARN